MSLTEQISTIIEQMTEKNQMLVFELVKTMISLDDVLTHEDIEDIKQARAEFARGEYLRHEDINWRRVSCDSSVIDFSRYEHKFPCTKVEL